MTSLFAHPEFLWLMLVAPLLLVLERRAERRRAAALRAFGDPSLLARTSMLPRNEGHSFRRWLRAVGILAAVAALARPQWGRHPSPLARSGRDLVIALDLSRSMRVTDVGGSRLAEAKRLAWKLASLTPGDRVGLVIFGGAGFLMLPPSTDLGTFQHFLDAASPDLIGDPSTNLSAPLRIAEHALRREGAQLGSRAIILLSDGEASEPDATGSILDSLRQQELPVFTVGIGTSAGGKVPEDSGSVTGAWHLDDIGRPIVSTLVENDLIHVASATGGRYTRWDDASAIQAASKALATLQPKLRAGRDASEPNERYQLLLGLAVAALGLELLLGNGLLRFRPSLAYGGAAALALVFVAGNSCGGGSRELAAGRQLYEQGKWAEAYQAFNSAAGNNNNPGVRYNAGNAEYRMLRYLDAVKTWRLVPPGSTRLSQWTYFNLGNAYFRADQDADGQGDNLRKAIGAYEEALRIDPADQDAKWNLELALRRRGDTGDRGSRGQGGRADAGRGQMRDQGYDETRQAAVGAMAGGGMGDAEGESATELNENDARQMLETIERQQLSSHEGRPASRGPTGEKDW